MGDHEDARLHGELSCSFCSKRLRDVRKLIAGPATVYICDECISLCVDILIEEGGALAEAKRAKWEVFASTDAQAAAARLITVSEMDPRVPQIFTDLAVALAAALDKHLNPKRR